MKTKLLCVLAVSGILSSFQMSAQPTSMPFVLDFEGELLSDFYNGGLGSRGSGPGVDYGVTFSDNAVSVIDSDAGGTSNFGGEPSPDTAMIFVGVSSAIMNVAAGFDTGFSLYYSAIIFPGNVVIYDGFDGTGNVLATLELPVTPRDGGDPNGSFSPFYPVGVSFSGTAHSIMFSYVSDITGFDDITIGSAIAGERKEVFDSSHLTIPITRNTWDLDPDGLLGETPEFAVVGTLPRGLRIEGSNLIGFISELGVHSFTIVGTGNRSEVRTEFNIEVISPTICPIITGVAVNGVSYPTVIQTAPTHGTPAITELVIITSPLNEAVTIGLEWDWIKGDYCYRLIRGVLPAGLIMDEATGVISGVPTETGEFIFVVSVKDWRGRAFQWIRLVVE
jgi:hypothetical protein